MGVADGETLAAFLKSADGRALELTQLVETADSIYLGAIGLDRVQPLFHNIRGFNFSGVLSSDAAIRVEKIVHPADGRAAHVVVFRQFSTSPYQDHPEDVIMGWFPDVKRAEGETWVLQMAALLETLLMLGAES